MPLDSVSADQLSFMFWLNTWLYLLLQGALCAYCLDRIWGLGRQGFKCLECKLMIHKKCHKFVKKPCSHEAVEPSSKPEDANGDSPVIQSKSFKLNSIVSCLWRTNGLFCRKKKLSMYSWFKISILDYREIM